MGITNLDSLTLGGDLIVAGSETITGGVVYAGNVTLGDSSADVVTIDGTSQVNAPFTVGVNDTGYDVKLFGATTGKSFLWDESADKAIITGDVSVSGITTIIQGGRIVSNFNTGTVEFVTVNTQQVLSTAAAVTLTEYNTTVNTTSGALAITLADATMFGQKKRVQMIVDGGDATLTFNSTATVVFADVGDVAELTFNGVDWIPTALYNIVDGATAPVYTAA